ncbi:hypothetical protein G3A1_017 [Escherichia phage vB_EcoP-G3A1]|uniref:Uncharacterized protein n=1 Tax=Escherichia phage vB_EcoP-101117UKE2 TaxID=2865796 RepID=A0AAE8C3E9_9CAUD|nr:hypothetical protein 101117UKE2_017 [Escherichia phage vB_EcoP-101117UKE2]QZI79642.1 hypothetical protein 101118B1_017 [Escherichia phage vB_EcoP-101118B1]QZI81246.1 hypothetical protein G3A1_017 [Escherichia phage vB_EcoP-G3A1]
MVACRPLLQHMFTQPLLCPSKRVYLIPKTYIFRYKVIM